MSTPQDPNVPKEENADQAPKIVPVEAKTEENAVQKDISVKPGEAETAQDTTNNNNNDHRPWDNANRRVVLHNVFKYLDTKTGKKLADQWAVQATQKLKQTITVDKIRKPPRDSFMVVTLMEASMVQPFLDFIANPENNIVNKKGGRIMAKASMKEDDHDNDGNHRKRKDRDHDQQLGDKNRKRHHREEIAQAARRPMTAHEVRSKITPLYQLSAEQQVQQKTMEMVRKCAMAMSKEIKSRFRTLHQTKSRQASNRRGSQGDPTYAWVKEKRCIPIQPLVTVPSPLRNKVEYTFGYRYVYETDTDDATKDNDATRTKDATTPMEEEAKVETVVPKDVKVETVVPEADGPNDATMTEAKESSSTAEPTLPVRKIPSVGFMATGWSGGVSKPHCCANIPSEQCAVVDVLEDFLQDSPLPVYEPKSHQGFWRYITLRTSRRTKQCMLIVGHAPVSGGVGDKDNDAVDYTEKWQTERERLIQTLQNTQLPVRSETGQDLGFTLPITSFFLQEFDGLSNPSPDHPVQHVFGKTVLEEELGKCTFQISPGAFFQVNTEGAELLYQIVMDRLQEFIQQREARREEKHKEVVPPKTNTLFDVCCGTGTIGLACLKAGVVDRVVGVDISEPAIEDAKRNAKVNGFEDGKEDGDSETKTRFVAARAEHVMNKEISKATKSSNSKKGAGHRFMAVVDPARVGLHTDVIRALRNAPQIQRVVYVSCNPTGSLIKDAGLLCAPPTKKYGGTAFRPTSSHPVDMFPLTSHCEMVMTFDRCQESDITGEPKDENTASVTGDVTTTGEAQTGTSAENDVKEG